MTQIERIINDLRLEAQLYDARLRLDGMLIQGELGRDVNELDWASTVAEIAGLERELAGIVEPEPEHDAGYYENEMYDQLRRGE